MARSWLSIECEATRRLGTYRPAIAPPARFTGQRQADAWQHSGVDPAEAFTGQKSAKLAGYNRPLGYDLASDGVTLTPNQTEQAVIHGSDLVVLRLVPPRA